MKREMSLLAQAAALLCLFSSCTCRSGSESSCNPCGESEYTYALTARAIMPPLGKAGASLETVSCDTFRGKLVASAYQYDNVIDSGAMGSSCALSVGSSSPSSVPSSFTGTNNQVAGVEEGDFVKTDGVTAYVISGKSVQISRAWPAKNASYLGKITLPGEGMRLLLDAAKAHLVVISQAESSDRSFVLTYDVKDPSKPVLMKAREVRGYLDQSRRMEDSAWMVFRDYAQNPASDDLGPCDSPWVEEWAPASRGFYRLVSLQISSGETREKWILGSGDISYFSKNILYFGTMNSEGGTNLHRITLSPSGAQYDGSGTVSGRVRGSYSLDHSNGQLRVVDTGSATRVHVLALDHGKLVQQSETPEIAPGESLRASRFVGNRLYLTTARNIDPFFVVDLKQTPRVLGELKIPGISTFLQPIDETHVIGVGRVAGPHGTQLEVSLFDVQDPHSPVQKSVLRLPGYSEAEYDPLAFTYSDENSMAMFPVDYQKMQLVRVDCDGRLSSQGVLALPPLIYWSNWSRGFFVENQVFAANASGLRSALATTPENPLTQITFPIGGGAQ